MCQSSNWTTGVDENAQRSYIRFMRDEIAARHSSLIDQAHSAPKQFLIVESENLVNAQFLYPTMSYCIGLDTSIIQTSLSPDTALNAIQNFWETELLETLKTILTTEDPEESLRQILPDNENSLFIAQNIYGEVSDYSFEEGDIPPFPSHAISVDVEGMVKVTNSSEDCSDNRIGGDLNDYLCLNVFRAFGIGESYTRRSECEDLSGRSVVISNVSADGTTKVVYSDI